MDLENLTRTALKVILAGSLFISSSNYQSPAYSQEKNLQENEERAEKKDYSLEEFLEVLGEERIKTISDEEMKIMNKKWERCGSIARKSFYEIYANPEKYLKKIKGNRTLGESFEKFAPSVLDKKERKFYEENFVFWNIDYKNPTTADRILLHTLYVGTRTNLFQDGFRVFGN